jgi:hypothetical protein
MVFGLMVEDLEMNALGLRIGVKEKKKVLEYVEVLYQMSCWASLIKKGVFLVKITMTKTTHRTSNSLDIVHSG